MRLEWNRLDKNKFTDVQSIATLLESYRADLVALLNGGLFLGENAKCALVELDCQHGVQQPLGIPRGFKPRAFWPFEAETVEVLTGRPINRPLGTFQQLVGNPVLDFTRPDGLLGITVQYAPPLGDISLSTFNPGAAQSNTVDLVLASLTLNPGPWILSATMGLVGIPTGFTLGLLSITTAVTNIGSDANGERVFTAAVPTATANSQLVIAGLPKTVTTPTTYNAVMRANFTGGSVSGYGRLSALRTGPDPATTARVRGLLVGG